MREFADAVLAIDLPPLDAAAEARADYEAWTTPAARDLRLDLGPCVATMRELLPADTIICNGAGNYSGWWHRYWRYAGPGCQLAPTAGAMGYGVPAATAAALNMIFGALPDTVAEKEFQGILKSLVDESNAQANVKKQLSTIAAISDNDSARYHPWRPVECRR